VIAEGLTKPSLRPTCLAIPPSLLILHATHIDLCCRLTICVCRATRQESVKTSEVREAAMSVVYAKAPASLWRIRIQGIFCVQRFSERPSEALIWMS
jgi:hypothetical protein